jgi:hypothetical protein
MATRPTQLHDARAHFHTVLVLHDNPNVRHAALDGFLATARDRGATFVLDVPAASTPIVDGRAIAERAPIVRARGAA